MPKGVATSWGLRGDKSRKKSGDVRETLRTKTQNQGGVTEKGLATCKGRDNYTRRVEKQLTKSGPMHNAQTKTLPEEMVMEKWSWS